MSDRSARAERLAELIAERELDLLLVTKLVNVRYLTGFGGTNGICVAGAGERLFFTDFRYTQRARDELDGGWELAPADRDLLPAIVAGFRGRVGFDDADLSVRQHAKLAELVAEQDGVELVPAGGLVEIVRRVKDSGELEAMSAAAALADEVYVAIRERGLVGRSEADVAAFAQAELRRRGAEPAFPPIVAAGENGAQPHAEAGEREIGAGELVTIDMGALLDGYNSDCTRTFATGETPDEQTATYELVRAAQAAALDAVRAGAEGKGVDAVAREMIDAAGHEEHFGHGLGHGVGLEVHESPTLSTQSEDVLVENETVTVEPGVYVEGSHGVRIEDLVVVTADGHRNLSSLPKELEVVA
ncbi:MAG: Xaa-Pro aminopeptidase [Solirubrobacterales bacterium]|nr:Xaa-Pro aminopeptidase [Solirubrobacterales bacterium]